VSPRPAIALRSAARGERDADAAPTLRARTVPTRAAHARSALDAPERCIVSERGRRDARRRGWRSRDARDELCGLGDASATQAVDWEDKQSRTVAREARERRETRRVTSSGSVNN